MQNYAGDGLEVDKSGSDFDFSRFRRFALS